MPIPMNSDAFADLKTVHDRRSIGVDAETQSLLDDLASIDRPQNVDEHRPEIVSRRSRPDLDHALTAKGCGVLDVDACQCAYPTQQDTHHRDTPHRNTHEPHNYRSILERYAGRRGDTATRQARLKAARLNEIALKKSWEGTRRRNRTDKLNAAEKFSAAVWATAAQKGMAVTLNLGSRREAMLLDHEDPHRRMMQNIHRNLSRNGFQDLPYAFAFEMTDREDGGRLHLHGVIDTSGLTSDDMKRLHDTLRNAGSKATGAIGGERQLHWSPLHDAAGWADYMLKSATRTARELDIAKEEIFMMNQSMRRAAKLFFERFSAETRQTMPVQSRITRSETTSGKGERKSRSTFTSMPISATLTMSGERDKRLAGGVSERASHQRRASPTSPSAMLAAKAMTHRLDVHHLHRSKKRHSHSCPKRSKRALGAWTCTSDEGRGRAPLARM